MKLMLWLLIGVVLVCEFAFASVTVTVNGSNHTIPQTNEKGWGTNVTAWIQAISQYTLQPSGGTFTLTSEVNTGSTYGFKVPYIKSVTSNPSSVGVLRLANNEGVGWRNAANGADLVLKANASDALEFNGVTVPTATAASVQDSTFSIYDNGDPTKLIAFQASGITGGQTRTITMPDANVNLGALTNSNIDAAAAIAYSKLSLSSSIVNADVSASAAIALSKLAATTASRVAITDSSGFLGAADTATYPSLTEFSYVKGVTSAIQNQINTLSLTSSNPYKISNCSLAASVGSSALTIALKDASGSDPSGGSSCTVAFRNATAATGTYADVSASAATSVVVSNGSSLGCTASAQCVLYVYAVNNAGTLVLGVIGGSTLDEGSLQSGVAEGGSGGADTINTLYTTATQSNKAVRLLGRVTITPAGSFAWTNAATEVSNVPFKTNPWYVNANISGANPSLGVSAVTGYTEIIDTGLTMTPISGSAPVAVMCSTTNAATTPTTSTSTCAAGSESIGANFYIPEPAVYEVCVQASWVGTVDTAEAVNAAFELIETPLNAQTLSLEGNVRTQVGVSGMTIASGADQATIQIVNTCALFNWTNVAAGTNKGVRLMYEQSITGTPDTSVLLLDGNSSNGQRDLNIRVRKL